MKKQFNIKILEKTQGNDLYLKNRRPVIKAWWFDIDNDWKKELCIQWNRCFFVIKSGQLIKEEENCLFVPVEYKKKALPTEFITCEANSIKQFIDTKYNGSVYLGPKVKNDASFLSRRDKFEKHEIIAVACSKPVLGKPHKFLVLQRNGVLTCLDANLKVLYSIGIHHGILDAADIFLPHTNPDHAHIIISAHVVSKRTLWIKETPVNSECVFRIMNTKVIEKIPEERLIACSNSEKKFFFNNKGERYLFSGDNKGQKSYSFKKQKGCLYEVITSTSNSEVLVMKINYPEKRFSLFSENGEKLWNESIPTSEENDKTVIAGCLSTVTEKKDPLILVYFRTTHYIKEYDVMVYKEQVRIYHNNGSCIGRYEFPFTGALYTDSPYLLMVPTQNEHEYLIVIILHDLIRTLLCN